MIGIILGFITGTVLYGLIYGWFWAVDKIPGIFGWKVWLMLSLTFAFIFTLYEISGEFD